jgi:hypothetical protein
MEVEMKSTLLMTAIPALFASALFTATPAAAGGSDSQAVAQCRAELLSRFDAGAIRSYRVGAIAGNSRRTRVTIYVNADRRYTFDCAAGANGEVLTASLNPPASTRLAGSGGSNQAQ